METRQWSDMHSISCTADKTTMQQTDPLSAPDLAERFAKQRRVTVDANNVGARTNLRLVSVRLTVWVRNQVSGGKDLSLLEAVREGRVSM